MLTEDRLKHIISRIIASANDAHSDYAANREDEFEGGRSLAYYEVLDIIKSELRIADADLEEFGLDIDLDNIYS